MGKFYAVMAGEYEEYHLLTICTIKEKAEEIASFFNADDEENEARVIELESWDNWSAEKSVYRVSFYDDYRLNRCYLCENMKDELTDNDTEIKEINCWWEKYSVFVCAESREQAIKKARDKLTEYKGGGKYERIRKTRRVNVCKLYKGQQMQARSRFPVQYMQSGV